MIIPLPQRMTPGEGHFSITEATRIKTDDAAQGVAETLAAMLRRATGFPIPVESGGAEAGAIALTTAGADESLGAEGYALTVTPEQVEIRAPQPAGVFYGVQTIRQMLPAAIESETAVAGVDWTLPAVSIQDFPRFRWRGLHLDCGRYMFPVEFVKKFIDLMALHKLNTFHWHLTEDQGWRMEIKQYPKLTEIGSKRKASPYPADRHTLDGKPHEGFYTQEDAKEIVAYAAERFITVVPEIEMPGHAVAALASYPELGCVGEGYEVRQFWGIAEDVFCAGNEEVFTFLQNVLDEVLELFPSEYIHIGGDECPKVRWENCPKCQARIKEEGLADEYELQSYFIRRMEKYLNDKGRRLIGWDEILEGGLAPNATVMSWRGTQGGIDAAMAGHDVVMSPNTYVYLDYYQSEDTANEPPAIGGFVPLEKTYAFDPVEGLPEDKAGYVIGGQGNVWTEYMPTSQQVEYMTYPRASAMAEAIWSDPALHNYDDFLSRLKPHLARLDKLSVNYRKLD